MTEQTDNLFRAFRRFGHLTPAFCLAAAATAPSSWAGPSAGGDRP
jgi:hypothetical protein